MKSASRSSIFALAIGLLASMSASAAPFQLGILGNLQLSSTSVNFGAGTVADGGPYAADPGTGAFTVSQLAIGDVFGVLGITKGQAGSIRSFSTLTPVSPFMSFSGSTVSMTGTIPMGDLGPFFFQDTSFGTVASFNVSGDLLNGSTVLGKYQGVFTATFNGIDGTTLLTTLGAGGTITTAYAATFSTDATVTPAAVTPEPSTLLLISLPLLGIGFISRKREIKLPRMLPKVLMALVAVCVLSATASAAQLTIGGNLQVGPDFVDFGAGTDSDGGPYVDLGTGAFNVMQIQSGNPFSNLGIVLGQKGTIKSFPTSTLTVVPPFMTFTGSTVSMNVTGQVGPFFLQDTNFGAIFSFNVAGNLLNGASTVGTYTGTFSATFIGTTVAELISQITTDKALISTPFVATFDAVSAVPEPGTLAFAGAGLAALVAFRRRRATR